MEDGGVTIQQTKTLMKKIVVGVKEAYFVLMGLMILIFGLTIFISAPVAIGHYFGMCTDWIVLVSLLTILTVIVVSIQTLLETNEDKITFSLFVLCGFLLLTLGSLCLTIYQQNPSIHRFYTRIFH